jgi:phosphonoacetaldehyde reductase
MALAASTAGAVIATTRTTAAHALSYHLTSRHGVSHGHAVALTLGLMIGYNEEVDETSCRDPRGVDHVRAAIREVCSLLGVQDGQGARRFLTGLTGRLGLAQTVDQACPDGVDRSAWAADVNPERMLNNPRVITDSDLSEIVGAA